MSATERQGMLENAGTMGTMMLGGMQGKEDDKQTRSCWSIACGCCIRGE